MEISKRLLRTAAPHQHDHAAQFTECLVKNESECKLYRQISSDEANPKWECVDEDYKDTACLEE